MIRNILIKLKIPSRNKEITVTNVLFYLLFIFIAIILFLTIINSSEKWIWSKWDDADFLGMANNFRKGRWLTANYIEQEIIHTQNPVEKLEKYDQIQRPLTHTGPIYMILLGFWLNLFNPSPPEWYLISLLFSLFLTILQVSLNYFYLKKNGNITSLLVTISIIMLPSTYWSSARLRPEVLSLIFMMMCFYSTLYSSFYDYKRIALSGIVMGAAHLVHPISVPLGISVNLYYLIFKKYKNVVIFDIFWFITLFPWMCYNQLTYSDYSLGLLLPNIFTSFQNSGLEVQIKNLPMTLTSPIITYRGLFMEIERLYGMGVIFILILFLGLFGLLFDSYRKIHKNRSNIIKIKNNIFYLLFLVVSMLSYYYLSLVTGRIIPESRFIFPIIPIIMPWVFKGIFSLLNKYSLKMQYIPLLFFFILITYSSVVGISKINAYQDRMSESISDKICNDWINENVDKNANVLTNGATPLYLRTGLNALYMDPSWMSNVTYFEWAIRKFNISHVILYRRHAINLKLDNFIYEKIYSNYSNSIFKITDDVSQLNWSKMDIKWNITFSSGVGNLGITRSSKNNTSSFVDISLVEGSFSAVYLTHKVNITATKFNNITYLILPILGGNATSTINIILYSYKGANKTGNAQFIYVYAGTGQKYILVDISSPYRVEGAYDKRNIKQILLSFNNAVPGYLRIDTPMTTNK